MITWADVLADRQGVVHKPAYTLYSLCGTGVPSEVGYPFDIGDALEQEGLVDHRPVSYGPDGVPNAFPMEPSIQSGVAEYTRMLLLTSPEEPHASISYSQGAIVASIVYDLMRTPGHVLHPYLASFLGAVTFGNPRRQAGHTIPGGIDPGGSGIVTPNMVDTPDSWWDFADGKAMVNSPGNDLYCTCGAGETGTAQLDQRAIWTIVDKGTFSSMGNLLKQLLKILPSPLSGGLAAAQAALGALDFFVVHGITSHTSYQFVQPIAGDPRDCWRVALDYLASLANRPAPVASHTGPVALASSVLPQNVKDAITVTAPTASPVASIAGALDLGSIEAELKGAVTGLLDGLKFVQKFEALIPVQYRATIDTAVKVLTVVDGLL